MGQILDSCSSHIQREGERNYENDLPERERERERMENGDGGIDRCSSCRGGGFGLFPSLEDSSIPCFPPPSPGQLHQNTNPHYAE